MTISPLRFDDLRTLDINFLPTRGPLKILRVKEFPLIW